MQTIFDFLLAFLRAYSVATVLFLIISIFYKPFRQLKKGYLDNANLMALPLAVTIIAIAAYLLFNLYLVARGSKYPSLYGVRVGPFYWTFFAMGIVPLLFISKQLRQKESITLLVIVAVNCSNIIQQRPLVNYLPLSSTPFQSYSYDPTPFYYVLIMIFAIVYFVIAFKLAKKSKPAENNSPQL